MIRVTVELISGIDPSRNEILGVAEISNDVVKTLSSNGARGDYKFTLSKRGAQVRQIWKRGRVEGFERKRKGGWDLLYLVLKSAVGDRN